MRVYILAVLASLVFTASAKASTGPFGFATGFGLGIGAIDISDGTNRYNMGGSMAYLYFGVHAKDFVFGLEGQILAFNGTITDNVTNFELFMKYYLFQGIYMKLMGGYSWLYRTTSVGLVTTFSTYSGNSMGGALGWDIIGGDNAPFRLGLSAGLKRLDYKALTVRQGESTVTTDLTSSMNGVMFYGLIGLDWYL